MTSPSPGIVSPSSTTTMSPLRSSDEPTLLERPVGTPAVGRGLRPRPAQRRGLGAPAGLGDRLCVRGEEDREPEPGRDLDLEAQAARTAHRLEAGGGGDSDEGHEHRGDLHHEHHRVPDEAARVQLAEGVRDGGPQEVGVEDAPRPGRLAPWLGAAEGDEALEAARAAAEVDRHQGTIRLMFRRPSRRSGAAAPRWDPAPAPGRTSGRRR